MIILIYFYLVPTRAAVVLFAWLYVTIEYNGELNWRRKACQRPVQKVIRLTGIQEKILKSDVSAGEIVWDYNIVSGISPF